MSRFVPNRAPTPRRRLLAREIAGLLAVKLALLSVLYFAFFAAPPAQPDLAAHVLGPAIHH